MIRRVWSALAAVVMTVGMVLGFSNAALAHSDEFLSVPESGSTVADVTELQFTFAEAVEQSFPAEVVLTSAEGTAYELGAATFDASGATMTVPIVGGALPDGSYVAVYRIVSVDGHPASGELNFTVAGSSATPSEEASAVPIAEEAEDIAVTSDMLRSGEQAQSQLQLALGLVAAGAVALTIVIVFVALRRRRNADSK